MRKTVVILLILLGMDYFAWAEGIPPASAQNNAGSRQNGKVSGLLPSTHAVLIRDYAAAPGSKGTSVSFNAGTLIWLARSSVDGKVLVDSKLNYLGQEDIWIPGEYVATKEAFVKVAKWGGANRVTVDEGPDLSYEYAINPDGLVELFPGGEEPGRSKPLLGHLYQFKNIVWLRIKNDDLWQEAIFVVLPDGTLCVPGSESCRPRRAQ